MPDPTVYTNNPSTTVATNGYNGGASTGDAPAALTAETWTVTSSASFPATSNATIPTTSFHIADAAASTELIQVTNISGTTWTLTRGVEGTTPVTHAAGATFYQIVSASDLTQMLKGTGADVTQFNLSASTTETAVVTYQPVTGEIVAGTVLYVNCSGTIRVTSTPTITWQLRWGWVNSGTPGTSIGSLVSGTNCTALSSSMSVARIMNLLGFVTFVSTTSACSTLNFSFAVNATTSVGTGLAASTAPTTISGSGPLALTATWSASSTSSISLSIPVAAIVRAA